MSALASHRPWCADTGHTPDTPCTSAPLHTATAQPGYADGITAATLNLTAEDDGTALLNVFTTHPENTLGVYGFSLRPGQIRPFAMALLAHDARLLGDDAAAGYYSAEARRGQDGA